MHLLLSMGTLTESLLARLSLRMLQVSSELHSTPDKCCTPVGVTLHLSRLSFCTTLQCGGQRTRQIYISLAHASQTHPLSHYLFCRKASDSFRTSFSESRVPSNSTAVTDASFSRSAFLRSILRDPACPMFAPQHKANLSWRHLPQR